MKQLPARLRKIVRLSFDPLYRRGLRFGVAAAIEHIAALRILDVKTVIDVGANKGQFSLLVRSMFPNARIHAFEPLAEPAACYRELFAGDPKTTLYMMALGPTNEESSIHVSGRADSSSLLPILDRQVSLYPGTQAVDQRKVILRRGDDILKDKITEGHLLIKLDVQGYEKSALEGMPELILKADYIYAEIAFQELYGNQCLAAELISWLEARGFRLKAIYNTSTDENGQPVYADALFTRSCQLQD